MRRLALTLTLTGTLTGSVLALGVGCTSRVPPPEPRPESEAAWRLAIGDELAGHDLAARTDGPWRIRSTRTHDEGGAGSRMATGSRAVRAPTKAAARKLSDASGAASVAELRARPEVGFVGIAGGGASDGDFEGSGEAAGVRPAAAPGAPPAAGTEAKSFSFGDVPMTSEAFGLTTASGSASGAASGAAADPLRAGATDDNADYDAYLSFLATWVDRKKIQDLYQPLDVGDRQFVRVVDAEGRPVPGAIVSIVDEVADRVLFSATTYGDGRVPYYPRLGGEPRGDSAALLIEALVRDADGNLRGVRAPWDGAGSEVEVALDDVFAVPEPVQLDVCFVIDTTGSMADEIESIKASLLKVTEKLRGLGREFDLRYSAVLYRDIGDDYVTATHPFTGDIEAFDTALRAVGAGGGGDGPESLNQAVAQAVDGVAWRDGAAKVAFLIADAPPHMDYAGDVPYGEGARAALARGIRIHAVAASGLDAVGTLVFRQIAQLTRGKFIFIEYGTPEASAESHGVAGAVKHDNLEDILFEQIRDEVAHFGR